MQEGKSQLGFVINGVDLSNLTDQEFENIQQALWTHGVICIKNQNLTAQQQIAFTERWGKLVILPSFYAFDNREPEYPAIVRVGNVRLDDTVKPNSKDAEYWHKDGDFRQPGENFILSILTPKEIAQVGGQTGYVDSEQILNDMPADLREKLEGAKSIIRSQNISDFSSAKPEEHYPEAHHPAIATHPISGKKILNITYNNLNDVVLKDGTILNSRDIIPEIEQVYKIYSHRWEMGDVVIWDNIRVIHRSMGGFGNSRRLLYRTQAQII
ncbi:taurine catabolism dioxygenase, TauD/TfdA family protein (macronuclear) [Tetrahymena thermophila SB210]|uniref:Taurine catabolism dioxygenase, TauD/TfdA family protein n=1 Tax=Tetrahymena thermophila (strain SB210) TaxID=312017 RepID=I7LSX8_TETTS|nr:taurine catabolism dioxygenase, TauD/TfdA family protein [Tetrahymena thermophila SB210]EAR83815.1 taurine catabolism dioxygenase, TauD/TfdA family protein [Tetrahymena thermophila SB210]|eukprot:XP_001031478.1 taurine catabolism dioxygenase, TauD/TfdA family protein [Tetrahymena thermophila SB210]